MTLYTIFPAGRDHQLVHEVYTFHIEETDSSAYVFICNGIGKKHSLGCFCCERNF